MSYFLYFPLYLPMILHLSRHFVNIYIYFIFIFVVFTQNHLLHFMYFHALISLYS